MTMSRSEKCKKAIVEALKKEVEIYCTVFLLSQSLNETICTLGSCALSTHNDIYIRILDMVYVTHNVTGSSDRTKIWLEIWFRINRYRTLPSPLSG